MRVITPDRGSNIDGLFGFILGEGGEHSIPWYWTVALILVGGISGAFVLDRNWDTETASLPMIISISAIVICAIFRAYEFCRVYVKEVINQPGELVLYILLMILGFCIRVLVLCIIMFVIGWIIAAFFMR